MTSNPTVNPIIVQVGGGLSYTVYGTGQSFPGAVTSFTLPAGLTTIGSYAFYGCSSLQSIAIPAGVTSIGTSAFRSCISLMELTVWASSPPTLGSNALTGVPANCSIRVPAGSVAAYKAATNWSARAAYITAI